MSCSFVFFSFIFDLCSIKMLQMNTAAAVRQIKADQEVKATAVASFKDPPPVNTFAKKALKNFKFAFFYISYNILQFSVLVKST